MKKIDPRITPTPKVAPPLNVPVYGPKQKLTKGVSYFISLIQKKPNVGQFPQTKGGPKKTSKPRQNY